MTPEQIQLCKSSWEKVEPISETAAALFYKNLFEADPSAESLFKGDMGEQGKKLMAMIGTAVRLLDKADQLIPAVQSLGVRHADYGVKDQHYDTVGGALLKTLSMGLGDAFTDEVKDAWATAYGVLATTMMDAANKNAQ